MSNDHTLLEVEDDEQRQNRIGAILQRINAKSSSASSASLNPILNTNLEHVPGPVEPPTELLERVQAFLPTISASNATLSQQRPEDINIEHIREGEERYIEMNLGLGVFEMKHRPGSRPCSTSPSSDLESLSDATSTESESDSESFCSDSESEDTYSSNEDSDDDDSDAESRSGSSVDIKPIVSRPIKPLPRRVSQQARIQV